MARSYTMTAATFAARITSAGWAKVILCTDGVFRTLTGAAPAFDPTAVEFRSWADVANAAGRRGTRIDPNYVAHRGLEFDGKFGRSAVVGVEAALTTLTNGEALEAAQREALLAACLKAYTESELIAA